MRPKRLKKRTQQFAEDWQRKNDRATEDRDRDFERGVKFQGPRSEFCRSSDRGSEREAGHKAGKDQRRGPDRVSERQSAQPQPQSFKNERADSRKEGDAGENRYTHGGRRLELDDLEPTLRRTRRRLLRRR